jgi:hypothetical protein
MVNLKKYISTAACGVLLASTMVAGAQIVVRLGPPPPRRVEVIPASPGPGYGWHAGYHRWDGQRYVWVPGTYERTPYEHARWVEGHWDHRGGGYVWREGHWAR